MAGDADIPGCLAQREVQFAKTMPMGTSYAPESP